jgi:hypothetical protein
LPPENRVVNTMPLSVRVPAGAPCAATAARKASRTIGPVTRWWQVTRSAYREWSSSQDKISVSVPPASCQWVKSDCHSWLGSSATNRIHDDFGRFFGSGTTNPRRVRYRLTVAGATVT